MTADDLLTYAKALSAGELFKNPETLQEMLTFDPNGMDGLMPYGLGLLDYSIYSGAPGSWGHEGQTLGFGTLWITIPESDVTVVGFTNSATFHVNFFLSLMETMGLTP
jgi:CubicO group peptidase (beta-lactamase class C family)